MTWIFQKSPRTRTSTIMKEYLAVVIGTVTEGAMVMYTALKSAAQNETSPGTGKL